MTKRYQRFVGRQLEREFLGHDAHVLLGDELERAPVGHVERHFRGGGGGGSGVFGQRVGVDDPHKAFLQVGCHDMSTIVGKRHWRQDAEQQTYVEHAVAVDPAVVFVEEIRAVGACDHHEVRHAARMVPQIRRDVVYLRESEQPTQCLLVQRLQASSSTNTSRTLPSSTVQQSSSVL